MAQAIASIDEPSTWPHFGALDSEFVQVAKNIAKNPPPAASLDRIPERRIHYGRLCRRHADEALESTNGQVTETEIHIPVRDGHRVRALLYKPVNGPTEGRKLIVLLHGGGFCVGTAEMESPACIRATHNYGCVSLSLEYRLSPEHKFPVPWEDVWDGLNWITRNASDWGVDLTKGFVLGGTSAGGHLSIPLSHRARDEGLYPPLTGIYLSTTPSLPDQTAPEEYRRLSKSRNQFKEGITLNQSSISMYDKAVEPDFESPLWSPMLWPTGHGSLPPTYFQICGADMLRDDALIYERVLRIDHGSSTKVDIYPGMPHVFWFTKPNHPVSAKYHQDAVNGLGWLLGQTS